jgi:hypothetical protein
MMIQGLRSLDPMSRRIPHLSYHYQLSTAAKSKCQIYECRHLKYKVLPSFLWEKQRPPLSKTTLET